MEPRRFYVIAATPGEHGPFTLDEMREALAQGVIEGHFQVRTGLGTMLGTVASQLAHAAPTLSADAEARRRGHARGSPSGMDSGQRRARQFNRFSLLVVVIILLLAGAMAMALRPGAPVTLPAPPVSGPGPAPAPVAAPPVPHGPAAPRVLAPVVEATASPPPLPPPTAFVPAPAPVRSLHRDLLVWDGGELGGGWRAPGPPTLVPLRDTSPANARRVGHAVVRCHTEASNFANFGWNWLGWFPADAGSDLTGMGSLIFAIRIVGEPAESVRVALNSSSNKSSSNEVDLVRLVPTVRDGAWHEVVVPLASLTAASHFDARKAWEIKILTWSTGTRTLDIYLDEIGFAR